MAIASTSALQPAWQQMQIDQAKRFAERAAQSANALQAQASAAQSVARQAEAQARSLTAEAGSARNTATQAERQWRSAEATRQIGPDVLDRVTKAVQPKDAATDLAVPQTTSSTAPQTASAAAPQSTINTQGQTIGSVISVTA